MPIVRIDASRITSWDTFHDVFAKDFGFPDFYGRNMDAWIDCMTCLDDPESCMTTVHGTSTDPVASISKISIYSRPNSTQRL